MAGTLRRELLEVMITVFGEPFAKLLVRRLVAAFTPDPAPATVSTLAIRSYLTGRGYATLAARQVERWGAEQLNGMNRQQADLLLRAAAATGDNTVDGTLRLVVAELARREGLLDPTS